MRLRSKAIAAVCCSALVTGILAGATANATQPTQSPDAPQAEVDALARDLRISPDQARARLVRQAEAHRVAAALPRSLHDRLAGMWFDPATGKLTVGVTDPAAADAARAVGAQPKPVSRNKAELDRLVAAVRALAGEGVTGLNGYGIDTINNEVLVTINRTRTDATTERFRRAVGNLGEGVRIHEVGSSPVQQSGEANPGDPWWPGGESNCSIGFGATDSSGGKHFVTAGHCTNDANQPAYGESLQRNRIGTSNVGGSHSVNAREGDMGVVAVTEPGWTVSASVNTWGQPAITVSGSADAIVGDAVCHSGNTAPNFECGTVTKVNQTIDYGGGIIVEGLTITTACSQGGDSGGAWLRGDKAVGMHSGAVNGNSCPAGDNAIYQPVNEALTKWGLILVTGGGGGDDTEPPTAPGNPRATGTTASSVSLAWDAATDNVGVTGYDVYNGATLAASVTGTSATVTGLAADTEYTFTVRARDAAGNVSKDSDPVTARTQPGGGRTFSNGTDYPIRDFQVTISRIASTATGPAANPVGVSITATHTCIQDLNITLVSPTGRWYPLQRYGGYPCTPFPGTTTYQVRPASGEPAGGPWTLRIGDNGPDDIGVLDSWSVTV